MQLTLVDQGPDSGRLAALLQIIDPECFEVLQSAILHSVLLRKVERLHSWNQLRYAECSYGMPSDWLTAATRDGTSAHRVPCVKK